MLILKWKEEKKKLYFLTITSNPFPYHRFRVIQSHSSGNIYHFHIFFFFFLIFSLLSIPFSKLPLNRLCRVNGKRFRGVHFVIFANEPFRATEQMQIIFFSLSPELIKINMLRTVDHLFRWVFFSILSSWMHSMCVCMSMCMAPNTCYCGKIFVKFFLNFLPFLLSFFMNVY